MYLIYYFYMTPKAASLIPVLRVYENYLLVVKELIEENFYGHVQRIQVECLMVSVVMFVVTVD